MKRINLRKYKQITAGKNIVIICDNFIIDGECIIGDNVCISAKKIHLGSGTVIEKNTTIKSIKRVMDFFILGDQSLIGFENQILLPSLYVGDYTQIHNHSLLSGYASMSIGHNCWVGQQSILNATTELNIKNNVRIGAQSRLWTHVASGELLEGCIVLDKKPILIEDNVWLVGGAVISPGLILSKNSVVLAGGVVTKSTRPFHTYAGVPAKDITHKVSFWKKITLDEKSKLIQEFIKEFEKENPNYKGKINFFESEEFILKGTGNIAVVKKIKDWDKAYSNKQSIFDLYTKQYIKRKTPIEIDWMKFIVGHRARFIPRNKESK